MAKVKKVVQTAQTQPAAAVEQPPVPEVRVIRSAKCPSVSGQSTITYEFGVRTVDTQAGEPGEPMFRITGNTGGGMFGKGWVSLRAILEVMKHPDNAETISARAFHEVFTGMSINTQSFALAALIGEGVIVSHPDRPRGYMVKGIAAYEKKVDALGSAEADGQAGATPELARDGAVVASGTSGDAPPDAPAASDGNGAVEAPGGTSKTPELKPDAKPTKRPVLRLTKRDAAQGIDTTPKE